MDSSNVSRERETTSAERDAFESERLCPLCVVSLRTLGRYMCVPLAVPLDRCPLLLATLLYSDIRRKAFSTSSASKRAFERTHAPLTHTSTVAYPRA